MRGSFSVFNRKFTDESGVDSFKRTTAHFSINNNFKLDKTTSLELTGSYRSKYEDAYYISFPIYGLRLMLQKTFLDKKLSTRIYFDDIFNTLVYDNERPFAEFKSSGSYKPQTRNIRLWVSYNFLENIKLPNEKINLIMKQLGDCKNWFRSL